MDVIKKIFEATLNFLKSDTLKILLNITAIVVAIIVVNIAEKSNESANQQFERKVKSQFVCKFHP